MAFFRPRSLRREVEKFDHHYKWRLVVQAFIATVGVPFLLTLFVGLLLKVIGISFNFTKSLFGMLVGVLSGMLSGMLSYVWWGVLGSVLSGVLIGVLSGVLSGILFGIEYGILWIVLYSVLVGVSLGILSGVLEGVLEGMWSGVLYGVLYSVLVGVSLGILSGVLEGVVLSAIFLVCYFRLFLLPIEVPVTFWALVQARRQPRQAALFLRQTLAYWDEVMLLPQPFLTPLLVQVGEQDREAGMAAIVYLVTNTFQRRAAMDAMLELGTRDLLRRRTVEGIAQLSQPLEWLSPGATTGVGVRETLQKRGMTKAYQRCLQISANVRVALFATSNYQKLMALNRARRGLDDLRQFAVLSLRGQESRMFAQVAQQWFDAVNVEIDHLTEEERIAERIPNPYVAPRPLSPGSDVFVGRAGVFRFVEEHFLRADQNVPVILHGQPRIGKSSVLRHFTTHLPTNLIPVYVDMQRAAQVESTGGLLFNLSDVVAQALSRRGVNLPVPALNDYATEPFIVFGKFLDAVETSIHAPENRIILALDEFEEIERKLREDKVSGDLMPFLRNTMQHRQGIALLFAGTHTLDEMIQDAWVPYFRSAVPLRVSYLDEVDARKLITNPIEAFPLDYEPEAVDRLVEATHCHPCLIQLACSALVDTKNGQRSRYASREDVEQALEQALETGDYVFRGVWDWIPPSERVVLSALASEGGATVEQLAYRGPASEGEIRRMLQRLTGAEVLEVVSDENGSPAFRFQVELFRRWVERHGAPAAVGVEGRS